MNVQFLVNGQTKLILIPENTVEEELLKSLAKIEVEIEQPTAGTVILGKTYNNAIIIGKKTRASDPEKEKM